MTDTQPDPLSESCQSGPIRTLLIANRGEIACRIIRTAQRLGIKTVAVFSNTDQLALHVEQADLAYPLGGNSAADSYLNANALIHAALKTGADAMHPGYGFLSENADFAHLCTTKGIRFVGPTAESIRSMGSKSAAKALMESSGVPLLPGYHGTKQETDFLEKTAATIGYPIMLKASAGGGGKGMRIVRSPGEFRDALGAVKRESLASFGNDQVLIERYVENPRHIEIQVFGDACNNHVHLFERDCSIQRRHQKVLEEAPAPHMTDAWRAQMGSAAVAAAKSINYVGAGTVEFIVDQEQQFYFMEMNTRLQVEHPVTEMITGVDLVEWQLRVAAGEALPCTQRDLNLTGHSIEARLYAEDTENEFLPSTGILSVLKFPANSDTLRIETGVRQGSEISVYYDPMMAKIISFGANRDSAISILIKALESTHILGVANNAAYLCRVLSTPAFRQAQLSTAFLEEHAASINLTPDDDSTVDGGFNKKTAAALAAIFISLEQVRSGSSTKTGANALCADGWRLNTAATTTITLATMDASNVYTVKLQRTDTTFTATCNAQHLTFRNVSTRGNTVLAELPERLMQARVLNAANAVSILCDHQEHRFMIASNSDFSSEGAHSQQSMLSPMPGKVIQVLVKEGDEVKQDQPVMIIEAMKMEHTIRANQPGIVETIYFKQHDPVDANAQLLVIAS